MMQRKITLIEKLVVVIYVHRIKAYEPSRREILEHFSKSDRRTIDRYLCHAYGYLERMPGNSGYTCNPRTPLVRAKGPKGSYTFSLTPAGVELAREMLDVMVSNLVLSSSVQIKDAFENVHRESAEKEIGGR